MIQASNKHRSSTTKRHAIQPDATPASIPNGSCHLLNLPPELRLNIYDTVFESLATDATYQELKYYTALLFTNKQIFSEAISSFHKHEKQLSSRLHGEWLAAYEETRRVESLHSYSYWPISSRRIRLIEQTPAPVKAAREHQNRCWLKYGRAKDRTDIVGEMRVEIEFLGRMECLWI